MKRKRVLAVDNEQSWRTLVMYALAEIYEVVTVASSDEAKEKLFGEHFDLAVLDGRLGGGSVHGMTIAKWCQELGIPVVMFVSDIAGLPLAQKTIAHDIIEKGVGSEEDLRNSAWLQTSPYQFRRKRLEVLKPLLDFEEYIEFLGRKSDEGAERIDARVDDGNIALVVYHRNKKSVICPASSIGCEGQCAFCLSRCRDFKRNLTVSELLGQILLGWKSYFLRGVFLNHPNEEEEVEEVIINFTGEGCALRNLHSTCQAAEIILKLGIPVRIIITTTGHERGLMEFLEKYKHLPIEFFWSVFSLVQETRDRFMPGSRDQSLVRLIDVFRRTAEVTGKPVTASFSLVEGLNNRPEDILLIKEFLGGKPFDVKLMAMEPFSLGENFWAPSEEKIQAFAMQVEQQAHLHCRIPKIIGGSIRGSCGSTIPREVFEDAPVGIMAS